MEKEHKEILRRNYMLLTAQLQTSITFVTNNLYSREVFSSRMKDDILQKSTDFDKASALLDLLPKRGPYAFDKFYECLKEAELEEAAAALKSEALPKCDPTIATASGDFAESAHPEFSDDETLPDVWPPKDLDGPKTEILLSTNFRERSRSKKYFDRYKRTLTKRGQEDTYSMKNKRKGKIIVINNEKFEKLKNRDGSNKDREALESLFEKFGFHFISFDNLKSEDMRAKLKTEAGSITKEDNCVVVVILSHGHNGRVYGTDGCKDKGESGKASNFIMIDDIVDIFCKVENLFGKPKIFFFQACQGTNKDSGVKPEVDPGSSNPTKTQLKDDLNVSMKNPKDAPDSSFTLDFLTEEQSDAVGEDRVASKADVYIGMSTPPDFVSWRLPKWGTWFIQAIVLVFSRYAYKLDIHGLMTKVNKLINTASTVEGGYKQTSQFKHTLRKDFYFFPGLYDDKL